jgi:hypothetical protein
MYTKPIAASVAFKAARSNTARVFPNIANDGESGSERLEKDRLTSINHTPKFKLDRNAPVFILGCCFARNIEMYLTQMGIECLTSSCTFPGDAYDLDGFGARNGALNAYTPGSMLDLLRLTRRTDPSNIGILSVGEGEYCDMLLSGLKFTDLSAAIAGRQRLLDTYASLSGAKTVIITLGYTEAWFDTIDETFVNRPPTGNMRLHERADRYEFVNMSAADCALALDGVVNEVRAQAGDEVRIVIGVSPIPLTSTFSAEDVIVANDFSKSALLSAIRTVTAKYDFCDYFPIYQFVPHTPRSSFFDNDGAHVKQDYVKRIIGRLVDNYFATQPVASVAPSST